MGYSNQDTIAQKYYEFASFLILSPFMLLTRLLGTSVSAKNQGKTVGFKRKNGRFQALKPLLGWNYEKNRIFTSMPADKSILKVQLSEIYLQMRLNLPSKNINHNQTSSNTPRLAIPVETFDSWDCGIIQGIANYGAKIKGIQAP